MWTPSEIELYCFLGGIAIGGAGVGYFTKWAMKDTTNAYKLEIAEYEQAVKIWREKAEAAVDQIRAVNAAIPKLLIASGFKSWSTEQSEKERRREQAKREMNADITRTNYDPDTDQWSFVRFSNVPPKS